MPSSTRILPFFFKRYKWKTIILYVAQLFNGMLEALGVAALLPLLATVMGEGAGEDSKLYKVLEQFFVSVGLEVTLPNILIFIAVIYSVKACFRFGIAKYLAHLFAQVVLDFRKSLLDAMLRSQWAFYTKKPVGHFLNALFVEAQRSGAVYKTLGEVISALLQILALLCVAALLSWQVALISILCGGAIWVLLFRYIRISGKAGLDQKDKTKEINAHVGDILQHYKPLKAMRAETEVFKTINQGIKQLYAIAKRQVLAKETMNILREPILVLILCAGLYGALHYAQMDPATLFVFAALFYRIMQGVGILQQNYQAFSGQKSFFTSMQDFIEEAQSHREDYTPGRAPTLEKSITFKNVDFDYGDKLVLNQCSLTIPAKKLVAITGPSGTGKTTVLDLVCRLYTPKGGTIYADDIALNDIDLYEWRAKIGYIPQEFVVFHDTILNNITLGSLDITQNDVIEALKKAEAWDFISDLPEGLKTVLGERGSRLSGGQRQRISIARALARHPKILIMDEATASLDPKTEKEIFKTLKALTSSITIIAISHQEGLKKAADNVIDLAQHQKKLSA